MAKIISHRRQPKSQYLDFFADVLAACVCFNFLEVGGTCVRLVIESIPLRQRQATQHDCLPRLLGAEAKKAKKCAVRKIIFCTGLTRAGQKSIVPARQTQ
jgi:hypothetical protein